jgi:predicted lipoprotein with Yx(FWY)xxD motif
MRRSIMALAPAVAALVVAGCGSSSSTSASKSPASPAPPTGYAPPASSAPPSASAGAGTVGLASTKLGQILVDSHGRTLYLFEKDTGTASTCYSACASVWPPLTTSGTPTAGPGLVAAKLGTTKRSDGQSEVTYNGHPLYYYVADTAPGQTTGQGLNQFGAGWDVLAPSGNKIEGSGH